MALAVITALSSASSTDAESTPRSRRPLDAPRVTAKAQIDAFAAPGRLSTVLPRTTRGLASKNRMTARVCLSSDGERPAGRLNVADIIDLFEARCELRVSEFFEFRVSVGGLVELRWAKKKERRASRTQHFCLRPLHRGKGQHIIESIVDNQDAGMKIGNDELVRELTALRTGDSNSSAKALRAKLSELRSRRRKKGRDPLSNATAG